MDTSEQNILMLRKARQIQMQFNPDEHNCLWDAWLRWDGYRDYKYDGYLLFAGGWVHQFSTYDGYLWHVIWVPRLDQLSAMLDELEWSLHKWTIPVLEYQVYISYMDDMVIDHADTVEQALLRMVMLFNYKKVWNGEDWEQKGE